MSEKLKEYSRKRDFDKTAEPTVNFVAGEARKTAKHIASEPLRFVVQHHLSRREHYDLRLEWEGVLLSWAVLKGISQSPEDKRLAVQVEAHPLEYRNFEGTIPEGQYGAGTVTIWDKGHWTLLKGDPNGNGSIKFLLTGERLNGIWTLIPTKEKNHWLLIKYSDNRNPFQTADVQLCKLVCELPQGEDWIYELKYDGYRALAFVEAGTAKLVSRNKNELNYKQISDSLVALANGKSMVLDGEIIVVDKLGKCDFRSLQNYNKAEHQLVYIIFDILAFDGEDLRKNQLIERKKKLSELLKNAPENLRYCEHINKVNKQAFENLCTGNYEGLIAKRVGSEYLGKRNGDWVKIKCREYIRNENFPIKISNPDKVVFTNPTITKGEIVEYYTTIAKRMLPFLKNRYLSLVKCPDGVSEDCFYNKNQNDALITVSNLDELIYQVQMNTIEFHTWGSPASDSEKPDIMVFDLDPDEGIELSVVQQGVKDLKSILDELQLVSYLKTSGGKGYHVVVRIKQDMDWQTFRDFAKNIAVIMEQKWPDRYTTNIRKQNRKRKSFVDWIRNTRGATSIAPYSIRARAGAAVSFPIKWEELQQIAPDGINMKMAIKTLEKQDPWKNFFD